MSTAEIKRLTLKDIYENSISKFSDLKSFNIIGGESLTYKQLGERVEHLKEILSSNGITKGAKVAILGASMPNWPVSYLSATTMGAIAVPLLPDFTAFEIANIIEHSGAKAIIISKRLIYKLSDSIRDKLDLIICMNTLELLKVPADNIIYPADQEKQAENNSNMVQASDGTANEIGPDDIASIIYTSGTSGTSKGVMLSHDNICSNVKMFLDIYPISTNDVFLSFLPLSHAYECTIGMLYPFSEGASVYYLDGAPTPSLLMPALKKVRPTCILSVPLIVEKIYKSKVRPMFTENWTMQFLYSISPVRRFLHKLAGKKLLEMFGGRLEFFGIGGSKLDAVVERFLKDAGFPYAIGYGLTECSPLIAGQAGKIIFQSTGPKLKAIEMKLIDQNEEGVGEVVVRGRNIMKGYYNDPVKTKAAFLEDGWFRTKDLGKFDKNGNLFLKGRADNMIVGANGENIYPEEIEAIINDNDFVLESMVVKSDDKLIAKVYFNYDQIAKLIDFKEMEASIRKNLSAKYQKLSDKYETLYEKYDKWRSERNLDKDAMIPGGKINVEIEKQDKGDKKASTKERKVREEIIVTFQDKLDKVQKDLLTYVNDRVNKTSRICEIVEQSVPFEKTATQKIKRYLYA